MATLKKIQPNFILRKYQSGSLKSFKLLQIHNHYQPCQRSRSHTTDLLLKRQSLCRRKMPDDSKCCRQCLILVRICCVASRDTLRSSLGDGWKRPVVVKSDRVGESGEITSCPRFMSGDILGFGDLLHRCVQPMWPLHAETGSGSGGAASCSWAPKLSIRAISVIWTNKQFLFKREGLAPWVTDCVEVTKVCLLTTWGPQWLPMITETVYGFNHT